MFFDLKQEYLYLKPLDPGSILHFQAIAFEIQLPQTKKMI